MRNMLLLLFPLFTYASPNIADLLPKSHKNILKNDYVVFIAHGTSCPMIRNFYPRVNKIEKEFSHQRVAFLYINSSLHDQESDIKKEIAEYKSSTPWIKDSTQALAKALGLKVTTQAVIYHPKSGKIKYSGSIDDSINFDRQLAKAHNNYLKDQLSLALKGQETKINQTEVFGCHISFKDDESLKP